MARTSKKKIGVYSGGVLLTSDVDNLKFTGNGQSGSLTSSNPVEVTEVIGGGFSTLVATGAVNSVNTQFTFSQQPSYIVSDGAWYLVNNGWTWDAGTLTATMTIPPNNAIFGIQ